MWCALMLGCHVSGIGLSCRGGTIHLMRSWRVCFAIAVAVAVTGCTNSKHTSSPSASTDVASHSVSTTSTSGVHEATTTTSPTTTTWTTAGGSARPSDSQIATQLARTHESEVPDEAFADGPPVTVDDGAGGYLTAVPALRSPSADGHGWLLFFWHNRTFLGWDTNQETWNVGVRADGQAIQATYPRYASGDAACCPSLPSITITYRWNGTGLVQDQPLPSEAIVGVTVFTGCSEGAIRARPYASVRLRVSL